MCLSVDVWFYVSVGYFYVRLLYPNDWFRDVNPLVIARGGQESSVPSNKLPTVVLLL